MELKKTIFKNRRGLEYVIVAFDHKTSKQNFFLVRFLVSGAYRVASMSDIKRGKVKDPLDRSVAGVGYYGVDSVDVNSKSRVYSVWHNMILRCYDPNCVEYKRYGAKGVSVCKRWHSFTQFAIDIKYLDGYDEYLFINNKIHLDKDLKQFNEEQLVYSPETCVFLSVSDNVKLCKRKRFPIVAISPEGIQREWSSVRAFHEAHPYIAVDNIYQVLCGAAKRASKWTFMYCNDYRKPVIRSK